jgi:hypothetical protein
LMAVPRANGGGRPAHRHHGWHDLDLPWPLPARGRTAPPTSGPRDGFGVRLPSASTPEVPQNANGYGTGACP